MDYCEFCGAEAFGFHACLTTDLRAVVKAKDRQIKKLESRLAKRKKGKRG